VGVRWRIARPFWWPQNESCGARIRKSFFTTQQSHVWNKRRGRCAQLWKTEMGKEKTKQNTSETDWLHDRSMIGLKYQRNIFSWEATGGGSSLIRIYIFFCISLLLAPLQWANTALERWERATRGHRVNRQLWVLWSHNWRNKWRLFRDAVGEMIRHA